MMFELHGCAQPPRAAYIPFEAALRVAVAEGHAYECRYDLCRATPQQAGVICSSRMLSMPQRDARAVRRDSQIRRGRAEPWRSKMRPEKAAACEKSDSEAAKRPRVSDGACVW